MEFAEENKNWGKEDVTGTKCEKTYIHRKNIRNCGDFL